jgi:hypothetical protein
MEKKLATAAQHLFFGPGLQFIGDAADTVDVAGAVGTDRSAIECVPDEAALDRTSHLSHARQLAWLVTRAGLPRPSVFAHMAAQFSSAQKLRQMVCLVKHVEQLEREGRAEVAADAWSWLDSELSRMRVDQGLLAYLDKVAARARIPAPRLTAHAVRNALVEELLPLLHAKWYLMSCNEQGTSAARAVHENYLARWRFSEVPDIGVIRVYDACLLGFARARRPVTPVICANTRRILGALDSRTPEYFQIAESFVHLARSSVDAHFERGTKRRILGFTRAPRLVRRTATVVRIFLASFRPGKPASTESDGEEWIECGLTLAHILARNPFDENAHKTLKYLMYYFDVAIARNVPGQWRRIQDRLQRVFRSVATPSTTERALCCRAYMGYEAARRLGVNIFDAASMERVVNEINGAVRKETISSITHTKAESWNHSLDAYAWARLPKVVAQGWISSASLYIEGLPKRRGPSLVSRLALLGLSRSSNGESSNPDLAPVSRWRLLVTRDVLASLQGAVGITLMAMVLLVGGMGQCALNVRYEQVLQSVSSGNDTAVVEHARKFVAAAPSSDPRIEQVSSFMNEALLRCVLVSMDRGDQETAATCLASHTNQNIRHLID